MPSIADDIAAIATIDAVPKILEVVCRVTGLRFSAVARVTDNRWVACAVRDEIAFGLEPGGELTVGTTICDEIRASGTLVVIDHASEDVLFRHHPTPKTYGFESYISVPIRLHDGQFFGTLCALDPRPARVNTPAIVDMFTLFADLIALHLNAAERLAVSERDLVLERRNAELREQFIAVLGHDLRNPLTAVQGAAELLLRRHIDPREMQLAMTIRDSAARMNELIGNILDFARSRLGGGITVSKTVDANVAVMLDQVIAELRTGWPDRVIQCDVSLRQPIACDSARIGQLFSNLLANALLHGDRSTPVYVNARSDESAFVLSVANRGEAIPLDALERLFQPFSRTAGQHGQQGLGLGLYIASEIAHAHGGVLEVISTTAETCFTFRMPLPHDGPAHGAGGKGCG